MIPAATCLAALALLATAPEPDVASKHLRQGAAHFRAERYAEALVEFTLASRLGAAAEGSWYRAAALVKLGRAEDAVEAFEAARALAPDEEDALLCYYSAVACYEAQLFTCARERFGKAAASAGPRVSAQAKVMVERLNVLDGELPSREAIDSHLARGERHSKAGRPRLAAMLFEEAGALARRRRDAHRLAEAERRAGDERRAGAEVAGGAR